MNAPNPKPARARGAPARLAVLVCGSRERPAGDWAALWARLDQLHAELGIAVVVAGGAVGPDRWAEGWALDRGVPHAVDPVIDAEWTAIGRTAGARRNSRMADTLSRYRNVGLDALVLALPHGEARGTSNMLEVAKLHGFRCEVHHHEEVS